MSKGCVLEPEKAASSDSHWPKSKLALYIGSATVASAVLGAMLWMPFSSGGADTVRVQAGNTDHTAAAQIKAEAQIPPQKQVVANPTVINIPDQQALKAYANEFNQLNSQIVSLQNEVDELTDETLDLNSELFQLELHLQGLEDQSTETRVVYNFVNVPIGKTIKTEAPPIPVVDLATSTIADSFTNDPVPEVVLLQEIAYDADNGFHLNSQFNENTYEDSDEPVASQEHWKIAYPPIGSE